MNQKEILEGLKYPPSFKQHQTAMHHARKLAYESTFGKQINPESVENVSRKAENLLNRIKTYVFTRGRREMLVLYDDIASYVNELEEALTASKLTI